MSANETRDVARVRTMVEHARWAAQAYADYDVEAVHRIVRATAEVAYEHAARFAELAVKETGFGVVKDKVTKNQAHSRGFVDEYGSLDYCSHRIDEEKRMISSPRPAGVVLAIAPSTSPVAATYFKVLSALLTRNAVIVSPHPIAAKTCTEAAKLMAAAATSAGAPEGVVQVVEEPTIPLVNALMRDERVGLILATGGSAVVRAAYQSGNPAIGVGPGNSPVVVDETADLEAAAEHLVTSKTFDNSVLCTAESVLFVVDSVADRLMSALQRRGAHLCSDAESDKVRAFMYPDGHFNSKVVGLPAAEIARSAGVQVSAGTALLLTPFEHVVDEEPFTHEKLSPVLGVRRVADFKRALQEARSLLRIVGTGHSAVIHSENPQRVLDWSIALPVHRMTVNAPGSIGNAGLGTHLAMTMSVGTGFHGGSSSGENLTPDHLVQWNRAVYSSSPETRFPDFSQVVPTPAPVRGPRVPALPTPSNEGARPTGQASTSSSYASPQSHAAHVPDFPKEDLRRIVLEELRELIGGN